MGVLDLICGVLEALLVIAALGAVVILILAGMWSGVNAKFDDKVEKEVRRRVRETLKYIDFNVRIDVIEDSLGYDD
jgi:nitrogen fixation-related uncharacterized protein